MKTDNQNKEVPYSGRIFNGFFMLFINIIFLPSLAVLIGMASDKSGMTWLLAIDILIAFACCLMISGYFVQQPNQGRVMIFFGKYCGTCRSTGFYWVNPFMTHKKISLRIRNMDVEPIKVNDKVGNPVMIGMVLVWKVRDTYRAVFDIDAESPAAVPGAAARATSSALENFVSIQSDAALREVTGLFAYDDEGSTEGEITLRGGSREIVELLEEKLNERLSMAGIEVVEARLNYLAYAPEIAAVMLRRQQASAIIAAREKIVEGAVSMVKMALHRLSEEQVVELDDERKASMVSNMLVVLCADEPAQPVVNTGTLYN
ncbi:MAG: SPFH domain-containing protein [Candidatus Amulumruptor sp.]|nr:SPFH domain-containing protein [Candidatus Amulumruptor sp.]